MSIVAMKNKSVVRYGSNRSAKPPGGHWLPQGPFGRSGTTNATILRNGIQSVGPVGFSISGTHRNIGYVGQNMKMSKSGTPFRGRNPVGHGGCCGTYKQAIPLLNSRVTNTLGDQYLYVKPAVLSQRGMLYKRFKYLYYGQYPNYFAKDVYTGNKTDNASQGIYIQERSAANTCVVEVNNSEEFKNKIVRCGPTGCSTTTAKYKYNDMARNGPYTKTIRTPQDSSTQTLNVQRRCANPPPDKRPKPVPDNGNGSACGAPISSTLL